MLTNEKLPYRSNLLDIVQYSDNRQRCLSLPTCIICRVQDTGKNHLVHILWKIVNSFYLDNII